MTNVRVRYAPSPTGMPHIGNIRTAVFDWLFARSTGGKFILRIEDTDRGRFVEGGGAAQFEALKWLGLDWDEGPIVGGPNEPYFQSERLDIYRPYIAQLLETGCAYKCFCTPERLKALRDSQEERGLPTGYDRKCRYLPDADRAALEASGAPFVIRFAIPREGAVSWVDPFSGPKSWECRLLDDHVLIKSDGFPLYHFAATVDDHLMGITHVIRGEEWLSSTPRHILLFEAFGWTPPTYVHTTHILGTDHKKLSKRDAAADFLNYKLEGYLPEAVFNFMALLGWSAGEEKKEIYSREELVSAFALEGLVGHPAILDKAKLLWYNAVYIRALSPDELVTRCLPFLVKAGLASESPEDEERAYLRAVLSLEQERMTTMQLFTMRRLSKSGSRVLASRTGFVKRPPALAI